MIDGSILIGSKAKRTDETFRAIDPSTGAELDPPFACAGPVDVAEAAALADAAFVTFADSDLETRAGFLEAIADGILAIGDDLIVRAMSETGLPRGRLENERGRTIGQLRLFADVVRAGEWAHVTIDPAQPDRTPAPRPDLRRRHFAIGPVAVFGASNFPLAFSVAGGDTASALAAGCPVIVKGHPAHPGTGELVARAVRQAVVDCGLPEGVFSYLPGPSNELGGALVDDPRIQAVGFTGSRAGGLALMRIANARSQPIPVYAEMSSINPVLLFPTALERRAEALGAAFVQSLTLGAGQFCTNPGLVIAVAGPGLDRFVAAAADALAKTQAQLMLTPGIRTQFEQGVAALETHADVATVARGCAASSAHQANGAIFRTSAADLLADPALMHEVFGSSSIVVEIADMKEAAHLIARLEGQLTATLHLDDEDQVQAAALIPLLARKVGRVLANGWPTGVEVCHAMMHGGPYPATSDGRSTSVGSLAIERFLRPVCYQDMPASLLPDILKPENPWNVPQRVSAGQG